MNMHTSRSVYFLPLSLTLLVSVNCEVFTAFVDLEPLLHTKAEIIKSLERYIEAEEQRLNRVRWFRYNYDKLLKAAMEDVDAFLSNPVNAYLLIKRLTTDWKGIMRNIEDSPGKGFQSWDMQMPTVSLNKLPEPTPPPNSLSGSVFTYVGLGRLIKLFRYRGNPQGILPSQIAVRLSYTMWRAIFEETTQLELRFPDSDDLQGAALGLMRIQDTYLLNTTKMAKGDIVAAVPSFQMTAGDCYELGYQAYGLRDFYHTVLWMRQSLEQLDQEESKSMNRSFIADWLNYATYMLEKERGSKQPNQEIATRVNSDEKQYQELEDALNNGLSIFRPMPESFTNYERLCRGEEVKSVKRRRRLYCLYTTGNSSYLLLQPVKLEVLSVKPRIVMYHDVIREKDIDLLKKLSTPKLERATVLYAQNRTLTHDSNRVSKSSWLNDSEHPRLAHLSQMLKEITGLDTSTADPWHVVNYGIGGHYEPHWDSSLGEEKDASEDGLGKRFATCLFYLSDVTAGGATVFPEIGVKVKPIKGSAAFWYNMKRNGTGDYGTKHAGCPVLAGSKWVAVKWFRERGQEFSKPCSLNPLE